MITALMVTLLVLLSLAVVILFAMLGELNARISESSAGGGTRRPESVQPLPDAKLGATVIEFPDGLARPPGVLLVLSTTCGACQELAPEARGFFASSGVDLVGVVVSCASAASGREFVAQYGLADLPGYVDVSGQFSMSALGVGMSPAAVALSPEGVVRSAVVFSSFNALSSWIASLDDPSGAAGGVSVAPGKDLV